MNFLWTTFLLLLFATSALGQIIVEPNQAEQNNQNEQMVIQINQRMAQIEAKINSLPDNSELTAIMNEQYKVYLEKQTATYNELVVLTVILSIVQVIFFMGILFYLKAQGKF